MVQVDDIDGILFWWDVLSITDVGNDTAEAVLPV